MTTELFQEYAELKVQEKTIKTRLDELKASVIEEMDSEGLDKQPTPAGTFSLIHAKKWDFSESVKETEKGLKKMMEKEKSDGTATFTEALELRFTHNKPEEV